MSYPPFSANHLWRARSFFCLLSLIALCAATARAQMGGVETDPGDRGSGGQNVIQGRVFFPSGRLVDRRLKVRLIGTTGADMFALTDDNGTFSFRRLAGGSYTLTVDAGKEYQPVNERVDIIQSNRRAASGTTYTVQIQLQPRPTGEGSPGVLNTAFAGVPKAALDLYEKALKAAQTGDNKKAVALLKNAIDLHPRFTLAHNELGVQYVKLGELDNAAAALREAIYFSPDAFSPRLNNGIVLFYKKQFQEAGEELDRALKINETSAIAHLFRGRAFIKTNDFAKAEQEFRRALSLGGGGEINEAYRFLGGIYNEQGKHALALQELETYLKVSPTVRDAEQIRKIIQELRAKTKSSRN